MPPIAREVEETERGSLAPSIAYGHPAPQEYPGDMEPKRKPLPPQPTPTVSRVLPDGRIVELVYQKGARRTRLIVGSGTSYEEVPRLSLPDGELVPYSATNNLIKHEVLLLAEHPEPFSSVPELISSIDRYLSRYVDLGDQFRTLASAYILLTWVYDAFQELPYLRLRGDYGSGKTRALLVIGSLCHKAFFASGASTVSPIFHTLDTFRGTLIFDEADFRFSDEKSELVKIFNNGNVRGFPVLRTQVTQKKEFEPRAFNVFGPKIVAMRKSFEDQALESRFFTEEMGGKTLRSDIPINLPESQKEEARELRNRLLSYRLATLPKLTVDDSLVDPTLSPRLNQILVPLLSIVEDEGLRDSIWNLVRGLDEDARKRNAQSIEGRLREVLRNLSAEQEGKPIPVGEITARLQTQMGNEIGRPITSRHVGYLLRSRLGIVPERRQGVYVVEPRCQPATGVSKATTPGPVGNDQEGKASHNPTERQGGMRACRTS